MSLALGVHVYTRINAGESALAVAGVSAVFSLAMVVGSLPVSRVLVSVRTGLLIRVLLGAIFGALIVAWLLDVSPEGLGALAVCGILTPSLNGALVGYMFAITPVGLQGRVASILAFVELFISAAVPLIVGAVVARELSGAGLAVAAGFMGAAWLVTLLSKGIGRIAKPGAWSEER